MPESRTEEPSSFASTPRERDRAQGPTNAVPPTGPRNGPRAPPSGPSATRNFTSPALSPPSGPASTSTRPAAAVFNAPSRPRGNFSGARGGYGGYQRDFAPPRRASEYQAPSRPSYNAGPPTGPRAIVGGAPPTGPAAFRSASSASYAPAPTVQRPQRFLADLPTPVPGGRQRPVKPLPNTEKVKKLDLEADRLRRQIEEAEVDKRARLREWERLQGEAESAKIGTELAAERLRVLEMEEFK